MGSSRAAAATVMLLPMAAAAAPAPGIATAAVPPAVRYAVKPGETLIGIADRALVRQGDWRGLARRNRIADPRRLPAGKVLVIPATLLKREPLTASIVAFSGQVTLAPGGLATVGGRVAAGTVLATGPNSFVTLALADGSRITLPSQSRIKVAALDRIVLDGRLERRFELLAGRGDFGVTPRERDADRFLVKTPVAVAAVRGTEFRMSHAGTASTISTVAGSVAGRAAAAGADIDVTAGTGSVLTTVSARVTALLPAPRLVDPGKVQHDPAVVFRLEPGGPPRRRVLLARDAGFIDVFAETETSGDTASFEGVGNGTLYARATAIDDDGVEGLPVAHEFERFVSGLKAEAGALAGKPRRTRFRWQPSGEGQRRYAFVLARDAALLDRIIDAPALAGTEMIVNGLAPGTWYWRVTVTAFDATRNPVRRHVRVFPVQALTIARQR